MEPQGEAPADTTEPVILKETTDDVKVGEYVGQCKWFNDVYGYGFLTVQAGQDKGKDIFVHHSGIQPLNSLYKTLKKGEYVNFNIVNGENGLQAVNVTGIGGGSLMCDVLPTVRKHSQEGALPGPPSGPPPRTGGGFTPVQYQKRQFTPNGERVMSAGAGRGVGGGGGGRGAGRGLKN